MNPCHTKSLGVIAMVREMSLNIDAAVRARLLELGCVIPDDAGQSAAALGAHVRAEVDKWTPVIKAAGVTAQ